MFINYIINMINKAKESLRALLENVCYSHGYAHGLAVMKHVEYDEEASRESNIDQHLDWESIKLAALLHDADDKKFFPNNLNYENTREILKNYDRIELVIKMIKLVSTSENGMIGPSDEIEEWMLKPSFADKLEALGPRGIERCYQYTKTIGRPLYTKHTPIPLSIDDLWNNIATKDRFAAYCTGKIKSPSMIDHYYDKLLRLTEFPVFNNTNYYEKEAIHRGHAMIKFIMYFAEEKKMTDEMVLDFLKKYDY